ncbi:hypothetical protein GGR52DRAFT_585566 [Hypoxylon sp. FL1284]|nr:hypothetical protein GGR52DRAFT_585566 [Hypoxylon sp. FL1284]
MYKPHCLFSRSPVNTTMSSIRRCLSIISALYSNHHVTRTHILFSNEKQTIILVKRQRVPTMHRIHYLASAPTQALGKSTRGPCGPSPPPRDVGELRRAGSIVRQGPGHAVRPGRGRRRANPRLPEPASDRAGGRSADEEAHRAGRRGPVDAEPAVRDGAGAGDPRAAAAPRRPAAGVPVRPARPGEPRGQAAGARRRPCAARRHPRGAGAARRAGPRGRRAARPLRVHEGRCQVPLLERYGVAAGPGRLPPRAAPARAHAQG